MALSGSTLNDIDLQCQSKCCIIKWDLNQVIYNKQPSKYAVIVLNTPITQSQRFFKDFWNNAKVRSTVDGGTKKWDTFVSKYSEETQKSIKLPDLVTGDFDSIPQDILEKYRQKGCDTHTGSGSHRFYKSLNGAKHALPGLQYKCTRKEEGVSTAWLELTRGQSWRVTGIRIRQVEHVIAIAQSSRRMDQIFGNFQTMFLAKEKKLLSSNAKVYLISDDAISWLLFPGSHVISIPEESRKHPRAWCSLVPVGEPCISVTSSGLKWNLSNQPLRFGELVSTSNTFTESHTVEVQCSHTLLWSMKVPSLIN